MRRTMLPLASAASALLLAGAVHPAAAGEPAHAAFPGENGDIAFVASNALDPVSSPMIPTIFLRSSDGSQYTPLVHPERAASPSWSPDGEKIAFVREDQKTGDELWVMDANGSRQVDLTDTPGYNRQPARFPDGKRIAVSSNRKGGNPDIYVLTLNAARDQVTGTTRLTNRDSRDIQPAVSPSGKRLAFVRIDWDNEFDFYGSVWTMEADGSNPADAITGGPFNFYSFFREPTWQPVPGATGSAGQ